jgi:hypothetical protein
MCTHALAASAESAVLDCNKKSLASAVRSVGIDNVTISFTGVCGGPIVVATDGLTLKGVGTAVIDGGGSDALTITGASRVSVIDVEVTNGANGIVARDGAHVSLTGVNVHDNAASGIVVRTASSLTLSDVASNNNGGMGLAGDDGVSITAQGATMTGNVARDIQLTFGARADFRTTVFGSYSCDATVLTRGTSGIFCPH